MINSVIIVSLAVFLLIGAAIILMLGLDKELHAERRERKSQKKKIASFKFRKRSKLSNLIERHEKLITESKTPGGVFFIMTVLSILGGLASGSSFSPIRCLRRCCRHRRAWSSDFAQIQADESKELPYRQNTRQHDDTHKLLHCHGGFHKIR